MTDLSLKDRKLILRSCRLLIFILKRHLVPDLASRRRSITITPANRNLLTVYYSLP